jgi:hypothetical protein
MARNPVRSSGARRNATTPPSDGATPDINHPNPQLGGPQNTIVERANDPSGESKLVQTPIKGGSYGVIPEAIQRITFGAPRAQAANRPEHKRPKTFLITGPVIQGQHPYAGKITFMYDHQRVYVTPNKEVHENMYDLAKLRQQGLILEEVIDPLADSRAVFDPQGVGEEGPDVSKTSCEGDPDGTVSDESTDTE